MLSCGIKQQCYLLLHVHGKTCPVNLPLVSALAWSLVLFTSRSQVTKAVGG